MNKYPVTIFVLISPEKDCLSAYTNNFEAEQDIKTRNAQFGYGYSIEPVSLTTTRSFYERLKHFFETKVEKQDVIEVKTVKTRGEKI